MMKKFKSMLMATAILAAALPAFSLVSCTKETYEDDTPQAGINLKVLKGAWYGNYVEKGVIRLDDGSDAAYNAAALVLNFNPDGTGTSATYYFPYELNQAPIAMTGGELDKTNGKFTFKIENDHVLKVTLGTGKNSKSITMTALADSTFSAKTDESEFVMISGEGLKEYFQQWEELLRNGGNADQNLGTSFMTDWENTETVIMSRMETPISLPWWTRANCAIPEAVRYDVKKADGWEMAFVSIGDAANPPYHYFGLYNKYTGILRVFHYIVSVGDHSRNLTYHVNLGSEYVPVKYPYYNAMAYGVPTCHSYRMEGSSIGDLEEQVILSATSSMDRSFQMYSTPYSIDDECIFESWYCFDVDLSGFVPSEKSWRSLSNKLNLLQIYPKATSSSNISLAGEIKGTIAGTYVEPVWSKPHTSGLGKACTVMSGLSSLVGGQLNMWSAMRKASDGWEAPANGPRIIEVEEEAEPAAAVENPAYIKPNKVIEWLNWGPMRPDAAGGWYMLQAALAGTSFIMNSVNAYQGEASSQLEEKGKIELNIDARITMDGVITQIDNLGEPVLNLSRESFDEANTNSGHLGTGIWGLQDDPVIYVDKDAILSTREEFKIVKNAGEDIWHNTEFPDYQARFIYFFDPSSVRINLNTALFSEIDSVKYNAFSGVFVEKETTGYTDKFRSFLKLDKRATLNFPSNNGNNTLNATSALKVIKVDPRLLTTERNNDMYNEKYSGKYTSKDSLYRYFGPVSAYKDYKFAADPQIYLPFDLKKKTIPAPAFPDVEVVVSVFFNHKVKVDVQGAPVYKEKTSYFQKHFIPKYIFLSHNEFKAKLAEMSAFAEKSHDDKPVGTLANDASVEVYCPSASSTLIPALLLNDAINK